MSLLVTESVCLKRSFNPSKSVKRMSRINSRPDLKACRVNSDRCCMPSHPLVTRAPQATLLPPKLRGMPDSYALLHAGNFHVSLIGFRRFRVHLSFLQLMDFIYMASSLSISYWLVRLRISFCSMFASTVIPCFLWFSQHIPCSALFALLSPCSTAWGRCGLVSHGSPPSLLHQVFALPYAPLTFCLLVELFVFCLLVLKPFIFETWQQDWGLTFSMCGVAYGHFLRRQLHQFCTVFGNCFPRGFSFSGIKTLYHFALGAHSDFFDHLWLHPCCGCSVQDCVFCLFLIGNGNIRICLYDIQNVLPFNFYGVSRFLDERNFLKTFCWFFTFVLCLCLACMLCLLISFVAVCLFELIVLGLLCNKFAWEVFFPRYRLLPSGTPNLEIGNPLHFLFDNGVFVSHSFAYRCIHGYFGQEFTFCLIQIRICARCVFMSKFFTHCLLDVLFAFCLFEPKPLTFSSVGDFDFGYFIYWYRPFFLICPGFSNSFALRVFVLNGASNCLGTCIVTHYHCGFHPRCGCWIQNCAFCLFSSCYGSYRSCLSDFRNLCEQHCAWANPFRNEGMFLKTLRSPFDLLISFLSASQKFTWLCRTFLSKKIWIFNVSSLCLRITIFCKFVLINFTFGILQCLYQTWKVIECQHGVSTSVSFLKYWVSIVSLDNLSRGTKHHLINAFCRSIAPGIFQRLIVFFAWLYSFGLCLFGDLICTSGKVFCKSSHQTSIFCHKEAFCHRFQFIHWSVQFPFCHPRHSFLFWHFAIFIPYGPGDLVLFTIYTFDSTMGFPGEGPTSQSWSCISANVNSIHSHPHVFEWNDDIICLQETRISETNIGFLQKSIKSQGKHIYHGTFIKETRRKNGHRHTPHGGVACIAPAALARPFLPEDDSTGFWDHLQKSTRVTAIWTQILPRVRCLIFSFYGQTSMEGQKHIDINDEILQKIFAVAAQFGEIPIIVAGDLQADPDQYQAVSVAKSVGWVDPISGIDHFGNNTRPITYSRSSDFLNPSENFSSIDAVLLNKVAATALKKCDVLHSDARQHAPIRVTFIWERIFQEGFVLQKPAALDLIDLPKQGNKLDQDRINSTAHKLWLSEFQTKCAHPDSDQAWNSINDFAVKTLIGNGAKFQKGLQTRGTMPQFTRQIACPGQLKNGSAVTLQSARLSKLHKLVSELNMRLSRPCTNHADFCITLKLQNKLAPLIPTIPGCHNWKADLHMNQISIAFVQKSLQNEIIKVREKEKKGRISAWRMRMINATQTRNVDKSVYRWIKEKNNSTTPNLITNSEGNVIFSPTEALQEINEQWDAVFSANIHHENPEKVLHTIWPYIKDSYNPVTLPPLCGDSLKRQCLKRKVNAAAGLDGWRTIEVQSLPICVFDAVSTFFSEIETGKRDFPQALTCVKQVLLDKNGGNSPMQKRIISLMSVFVVTYTGLRYAQLQSWQWQTLPEELYGGIKGRKMSEVYTQLQLQIDQSTSEDTGLIGLKLDKSKCFDRLIPSITAAIFVGFGLPVSLTMFFTKFYNSQKRFLAYKEWISDKPTTACNGLIQGCSLSLLAINLHMTIWVALMKCIPNLHTYAFIDDSYLWVRYHHADALVQAIKATQIWDQIVGQALNVKKCQSWATNRIARNKVKEILPEFEFCESVVVLGARIQTTLKKDFQWPPAKTQKILRDIELVKTIPCTRVVHEHLISTKVIPQLSFASHISSIPKTVLTKIQNQIADVLWKGRPSWRAKGLLLGILARPHRCDPVSARAFNTLFDCFSFLKKADPLHRQTWVDQFNSEWISPSSLIAHAFQACEILGIELVQPFHIVAWGAHPVSFLDFAKRDIKAVLVAACRHSVYHSATRSARKDLSASRNILDFPGTCCGNSMCADIPSDFNNLVCYCDSVVVGCVATNDRRAAASMSPTKCCRYCGFHDETFSHLAIFHVVVFRLLLNALLSTRNLVLTSSHMVSLKLKVSMSKRGWISLIPLTYLLLSGMILAIVILLLFGPMEVAIDNRLSGFVVGPSLSLVKMVQQLQMVMYITGHSQPTRANCGLSWLPFSVLPVTLYV